jgi:hypothetical protein
MAEAIKGMQVGQRWVSPEDPKTSKYLGRVLYEVKGWADRAGGAYDIMKMSKLLSACAGRADWVSSLGGYTSATSIPRLPCAVIELYEKCAEGNAEGYTPVLKAKVAQGMFDLGATSMFAFNFFNPLHKASGNIGTVLSSISDTFSIGVKGLELHESCELLTIAKDLKLADDIQVGLTAKRNFSGMKLVKTIASVVTGIFAAYALATGVVFLSAGTALAVSLGSAILGVTADFYKNCYSNYFAKIGSVPLTA